MAIVQKEFVITGRETHPAMRSTIPGSLAQKIIHQDEQFIATTTKTSPIVAKSAKGAVVLSVDGDLFLDFAAGVGVLNTGHCHPRVVQAIQDQAKELVHFAGTDYYYQVQASLAERLAGAAPGPAAKKVFYANSGTEANEAAIKLAIWNKQRPRLLAFMRAFHGRTLGSLALTNSKAVQRERFPTLPGAVHVPFPDPYRNVFGIDGYDDPDALTQAVLGFLEEMLDSSAPARDCAAFFVEPIQGEGGYIVPPMDFYRQLKKVLDAHGILLVADEVQTGMGRTGKLFAMEHFGVAADVTTVAKALGSGLPIGAAIFDAKLDFSVSGAHSNTFGGNPVACAAAMATLDVIEEERLVERAAELGVHLGKRLEEFRDEFPFLGDTRGLGLMWGLDFVKDAKKKTPDKERRDRIVVEAWKRGLITLPCGRSVLRLIPPLVVTREQLDGGLEVLREAIHAAKT